MKECMEITKDLELFHDGELPEDRRETVASHLENCPNCARELAVLAQLSQQIQGALGRIPDFGSLPGFETRVKAHIHSPEPQSGWSGGWRRVFSLRMGLVGGLAMAAVLCFMLMLPADQQGIRFTQRTPETIESDGTILVTKLPQSDVEVIYIFDVGV